MCVGGFVFIFVFALDNVCLLLETCT